MADGMYVFGGYFGGYTGSRGPSVNGARLGGTRRGTPRLRSGFGELNDLHFYDRQAQGGWNLHEFAGGGLEEFLGFSGLMI